MTRLSDSLSSIRSVVIAVRVPRDRMALVTSSGPLVLSAFRHFFPQKAQPSSRRRWLPATTTLPKVQTSTPPSPHLDLAGRGFFTWQRYVRRCPSG